MTARERLAAIVPAEVVELIEAFVDERVAELAGNGAAEPAPWLTLKQAGERLGCTTDAVRMRAKRGRLETRRHGRRVYVSATSVDRLAG